MSRPTAIAVLLDAFVARLDVRWRGRRAEAVALTRADAGSGSAAERLDELLARSPCTGPVLVLDDEVFLQSLDLPPRAIQGLRPRELDQAVAIEAQSFSGLGSDAVTAWTRPADDKAFLVSQCGNGEFAAVHEVVERAGGSLFALAHPAALPLPLGGDGSGRAVRVEEWGSVRAVVRSAAGRLERARVGNRPPNPADLEGATEHLFVRTPSLALGDAARFDLADDRALEQWLLRWAEAVCGEGAVPVLAPPESASVRNRRWLFAGLLTIAAGVAVMLDRSHVQQRILAASRAVVEARAPHDRLSTLEAEIATLQQRLENARTPSSPPAATSAIWSTQALASMLEHLARQRPPAIVLDDLALGWQRCRVRGLAPDSSSIDRFAERLGTALAPSGFAVQPGDRQRVPAGAVELFSFQLDLLPLVAPRANATAEENR